MKWFEELPRTLAEVRKLIQEFRKSPLRATKALVIFAIIVICVLTQWSGYSQGVFYVWMLGGLLLLIMVLLGTLGIARWLDRKKA